MHIQNLSLISFKNYGSLQINLHPKLNCFVGNNGAGKTNLLDAVYYLCMCKSYFHGTDLYSIRNSDEFMVLQGKFSKDEQAEELYCGLKRGKKKQFRRNKKEYTRLSEHIGLFPVVMVTPNDIQLITEGSEERRKYLDGVISQYNPHYLDDLIQYRRVLVQRNSLLKSMAGHTSQEELLDIFDEQLADIGRRIHSVRQEFIEEFIPVFNEYYQNISGGAEEVSLQYESQLNDSAFEDVLRQSRSKDIAAQHSTAGIHKDDLVLELGQRPIRRIGSQGQQKTYLVSLKMAQFEFLRRLKKFAPLLLLDDVFDKLDASRVKNLLHLVSQDAFGQIFITHTNLIGMQSILKELSVNHALYLVEKGNVERVPEN